jgi:hypothetical protein
MMLRQSQVEIQHLDMIGRSGDGCLAHAGRRRPHEDILMVLAEFNSTGLLCE